MGKLTIKYIDLDLYGSPHINLYLPPISSPVYTGTVVPRDLLEPPLWVEKNYCQFVFLLTIFSLNFTSISLEGRKIKDLLNIIIFPKTAQVKFSRRTSVSWRVQVQLLPFFFFGMYTEEVQDTLQETDVLRLNFTLAPKTVKETKKQTKHWDLPNPIKYDVTKSNIIYTK